MVMFFKDINIGKYLLGSFHISYFILILVHLMDCEENKIKFTLLAKENTFFFHDWCCCYMRCCLPITHFIHIGYLLIMDFIVRFYMAFFNYSEYCGRSFPFFSISYYKSTCVQRKLT